jgi:Glycosyltransferase family 87
VTLNIGFLGSDPWLFSPGTLDPHGPLGFVVRLADSEWDPGLLRSVAMLAGVGVVALAVAGCLLQDWRAWVLTLAALAVVAALVLPATLLQVGLREASAPWFFTNDSTFQLEIAGDLVRDGRTPYGHDYSSSGLERFYSLDGSVTPDVVDRQVALTHFAYFPGAALLAAGWTALPSPWSDVRILIALTTIALLGAALVFPGQLPARLALGVLLAANPLVVRAAWFGNADAPTLLLVVLAFGLAARKRPGWSGATLGAAILTKQFALVAVPFLAVTLLIQSRDALRRAGFVTGAVVLAGFLPFLIADPQAVWRDTVTYGTGTYRIVGYGLSSLLVRAGIIDDRTDAYPFFALVVLVWLPVTVILVRAQWRARAPWLGAAGFTASFFLLVFLGRAFHISYLVYPLTGILLAALLAFADGLGAAHSGAGDETTTTSARAA